LHRSHRRRFAAVAALALSAACGGGADNATAPQYQPQVVNLQNDFAFQVTALQNVSDNVQYTWKNDGTAASVNQSPSNLSGSVSLVILDAAGTQVYSRSLVDNGTFTTTAGTAGNWTVRVRFSQASGAVNFRLQKP
jgi:hypothetical protein